MRKIRAAAARTWTDAGTTAAADAPAVRRGGAMEER
jgi:hypothetical protein